MTEELKRKIEEEKERIKNHENSPAKIDKSTETSLMLQHQKQEVLRSSEAKDLGLKIATEDVKADFASEAAKINQKNMDTAEKEFDTKTRQRKLDRLNAELDLQHKYNMSMIKQNGEHLQMLDRKRKMVEKYGYLYSQDNMIKAIDGEGQEYLVPKDFSYSVTVNKFRQFGRNISKLDRPLLQTIKWMLILGGIALGVFVLKWTGIIR